MIILTWGPLWHCVFTLDLYVLYFELFKATRGNVAIPHAKWQRASSLQIPLTYIILIAIYCLVAGPLHHLYLRIHTQAVRMNP